MRKIINSLLELNFFFPLDKTLTIKTWIKTLRHLARGSQATKFLKRSEVKCAVAKTWTSFKALNQVRIFDKQRSPCRKRQVGIELFGGSAKQYERDKKITNEGPHFGCDRSGRNKISAKALYYTKHFLSVRNYCWQRGPYLQKEVWKSLNSNYKKTKRKWRSGNDWRSSQDAKSLLS